MRPVGLLIFTLALAQGPIAVRQTITLTPALDVFQTPAQTYQLSKLPATNTPVEVDLDGLVLCGPCGFDYSVSGQTLTFAPGQDVANFVGPVIQVKYWTVM